MAELKIEGNDNYGIIPKAITQDRNLSQSAKLIYSYLASFCGNKTQCFPSVSKVTYDLHMNKQTFGKYLKQLVQNGYVEVGQLRENGKFKNNVYTILPLHKSCDNSVDNSLNSQTKTVEPINNKNLIELENKLAEVEMAIKHIVAEKNIEIAELESKLIELEKNNKIAELKKKLKGVAQNG